jgi:FtsZ-binding cell division protein ZapB
MFEKILSYITNHWEFLAAPVAWLFGREQRKVSALDSMRQVYENFVEDYKDKYEDMQSEIQKLKVEVEALREENRLLKEEVKKWEKLYKESQKKT